MIQSGNLRVLIVGSGGREHAMAWKAAQSALLGKLYIAPGNPGTSRLGENVPIGVDDQAGLLAFCQANQIDLVLVGPEAPLAAGLADVLSQAGFKVFGPSAAAAEIESSKVFAKAFMQRAGIASARFAAFEDYDMAAAHLQAVDYPVVIKASGLAAGKGVILPDTLQEGLTALRSMLLDGEFGAAGQSVVIEERLSGPEVSLLAFSDGRTVRAMLPAQDHKRLLDGDRGPNTGGMGAYSPAPICPPELAEALERTVLQPAVDCLREEGRLYQGVLYAGIMLTGDGPRVLEFNCRFGDPETQALLPLLKSDLLEIALACVEGRLEDTEVEWQAGSAACVVLASQGYPAATVTGDLILGLDELPAESVCFQAGTRMVADQLVTAGGRVLGITAWGGDLPSALERVYGAVRGISFKGMQYRKDIGSRALPRAAAGAYAGSGVDIQAGNRAVQLMADSVKSTYNRNVLAGIGSFGGLFDADFLKNYQHPVLVASTDGVGTKVKLAAQAGRYQAIGQDIVNHCINDILVQGAMPLFFLDYFATSALQPEITAEIVSGMALACCEAGCALIGGETAEMPGVYAEGEFDVAGTIIGVLGKRAHPAPRGPGARGCAHRFALIRAAYQRLFADPAGLRPDGSGHDLPRAGYSAGGCLTDAAPLILDIVEAIAGGSPPAGKSPGASDRRRLYREYSAGAA